MTTEPNDKQNEEALPCPWCKAIPVAEQSLQPRWFQIKHGEYCIISLNEFGRGRTQYIELRFLNAWNRRAALASRDTEIREVLEGLSVEIARYGRCWCPYMHTEHEPSCLAARRVWERVQTEGDKNEPTE